MLLPFKREECASGARFLEKISNSWRCRFTRRKRRAYDRFAESPMNGTGGQESLSRLFAFERPVLHCKWTLHEKLDHAQIGRILLVCNIREGEHLERRGGRLHLPASRGQPFGSRQVGTGQRQLRVRDGK